MLHIHSSNRFAALVELLLARVGRGDGGVFAADQIVVPSAGVRRALTLAMATRSGICANVEFSFLATWLWRQIARVAPSAPAEPPFAAATLTWRFDSAFADAAFIAPHARLQRYLERADDVMRYELAGRTAGLFEQYVTYRPRWLAAWQGGRDDAVAAGDSDVAASDDERWQAALWRRLVGELGLAGPDPMREFVASLRRDPAGTARRAGLPATVHVFALPTLAPAHLELVERIGSAIDIHLYVLNPCREFWFEVVDARRLAELQARGESDGHEVGNRLLAAWGKQVQSTLGLLAGAGEQTRVETSHFEARSVDTLLGRLQNTVLDLVELEPGSVALAPDDRSVEVHVCHSMTRELEVLHDHLLGLFAGDAGPGLRPEHILVVTPDLDTAGPLIEAVFGTAPKERFVPYAVTGRPRSKVNAPAQAVLALLALVGSRFQASTVFGLLQLEIVARAYGFGADALAQVHEWMRTAGSRWALDADHRASFDVPAEARFTLGDALARLFLGYASPARVGEPFGDLLPAGDAEGSETAILGSFWRYVEDLRVLHAATAQPQPASAWPALLLDAADTFTKPSGDELDDARELRAAIRELGAQMQAGAGDRPVPLAVVREALQRALDDPARGGVPTGGVTFTSMASLRGLPYPVVCAIGMNDGAFPGLDRPPEFDLMALRPQFGDRQRRHDDRNVFLDLVLAAERGLYLSYSGRSARDNAPLPPSVLVAEWLDVIVPAIAAAAGDARGGASALAAARARIVVEHPLQPFSPVAFTASSDPRLLSFDRDLAAALRRAAEPDHPAVEVVGRPSEEPVRPEQGALDFGNDAGADPGMDQGVRQDHDANGAADRTGERDAAAAVEADGEGRDDEAVDGTSAPFFVAPLAPPGPEWKVVSLPQLIEFFNNPSRYLLRRRLGIDFGRHARELGDDEPFLPDILSRYGLADRLLPALLDGADAGAVRRLAAAGTDLPGGALGAQHLDDQLASLHRFAARVRAATEAPLLPAHDTSIALDLDGEAWRLDATFADLRPAGLVRWHYDELRARHVIGAWLCHLALCSDLPAGTEPETRWLTLDTTLRLRAPALPRPLLADVLRSYRRGLSEPLPLFPKSAWACWKNGREDPGAARLTWHPTRKRFWAEGADAAYRLAWRGRGDPLGDAFFDEARALFEPLLAHLDRDAVTP